MSTEVLKYLEYEKKRSSCFEAFKTVTNHFNIRSGLYAGSYIHITPSLFIPEMHYVDQDKKAIRFFREKNEILEYINSKKEYIEETTISFDGCSYWDKLSVHSEYDLLISLYAGFISQASKAYLKIGGILLANDSHGDATRAYYDKDYAFIGVLAYEDNKYYVETGELDKFFVLKKGTVNLEKVILEMKGPKYKYQTEYYLFQKLK